MPLCGWLYSLQRLTYSERDQRFEGQDRHLFHQFKGLYLLFQYTLKTHTKINIMNKHFCHYVLNL